ncbi:TetR/AcrR family transcriptional regulator [Streptomyces sp. NPDC001380]|uniref:TetR/AcrR family transcriptional regulator n=1 Tax=Streptomyces sp. NPDC001380 TaxID=3364566 RepID=UPI0036B96DD1
MEADITARTEDPVVPRRTRLRQQLIRDAKAAAREIAAADGLDGLSLTAVAHRVGVSPPALYRYFDGRQGLVRALYDDLTADLIAEVAAAFHRQDPDDRSAQLHAGIRAILTWSLANPAGFSLLMGDAHPSAAAAEAGIPEVLARELGGAFGELFLSLIRDGVLRYPEDDRIEPVLRSQLTVYQQAVKPDLPLGAVLVMLTCWRQVYGTVGLAVSRHLAFAFPSIDAFFEHMIGDILTLVGLTRSPNLR